MVVPQRRDHRQPGDRTHPGDEPDHDGDDEQRLEGDEQGLRALAERASVRSVLVTGTGRAFCSGGAGEDIIGKLVEVVGKTHSVTLQGHSVDAIPLPHPSWRSTNLVKKNPWFETDLLPDLRKRVRAALHS